MGDQIEITKWLKYFNIFYRVSNSGILFEVQSSGFVGIGLAKRPRITSACDHWVAIGANNRTWISKSHGHDKKEVITPNILSNEEYRSFWLSWSNNVIRLGYSGNSDSIIAKRHETLDINYVTFSIVEGGGDIARWRFTLSPLIEKPLHKTVSGGDLHWVSATASGPLPEGAVIGGYEVEPLYIIRAEHSGRLAFGVFKALERVASVTWHNFSYQKTEFEELCGFDFAWRSSYEMGDPTGIFIAGYSRIDQEHLYIGRAEHNGHLIPGKVNLSRRVCLIAFEGQEVTKEIYEILVIPEKSIS